MRRPHKFEKKNPIHLIKYSKAAIIRTDHWAVYTVHSMYCRTGISTGTYDRNFRVGVFNQNVINFTDVKELKLVLALLKARVGFNSSTWIKNR